MIWVEKFFFRFAICVFHKIGCGVYAMWLLDGLFYSNGGLNCYHNALLYVVK